MTSEPDTLIETAKSLINSMLLTASHFCRMHMRKPTAMIRVRRYDSYRVKSQNSRLHRAKWRAGTRCQRRFAECMHVARTNSAGVVLVRPYSWL